MIIIKRMEVQVLVSLILFTIYSMILHETHPLIQFFLIITSSLFQMSN